MRLKAIQGPFAGSDTRFGQKQALTHVHLVMSALPPKTEHQLE
jgi:hypothetical protein